MIPFRSDCFSISSNHNSLSYFVIDNQTHQAWEQADVDITWASIVQTSVIAEQCECQHHKGRRPFAQKACSIY